MDAQTQKQSVVLTAAVLILLVALPCSARQHYRSRIPNGDEIPCPPEDPHCEENERCIGVGHETCAGGVVSPKRNPFGEDFAFAGLKWTRELCEKDSDGDGFSNGYELGDPCCVWEEGVEVPKWMRDWPISHPGFPQSTQFFDEDVDLEKLCKKVDHLVKRRWYNEGEEEVTLEYFIKDHTIPAKDTVYEEIRFNFPDDQTYYIVGTETMIDNEELVHHYVVKGCSGKVDEKLVGTAVESEEMEVECEETLFLWAPGADYDFPKETAFPVGKGTNRVGFEVEMHYDNPLEKKGETDGSGIRFHMTTTPRKHEAGILWTGGILSVGAIPPKTKTYSSTVFQVKIDDQIAPDGIVLFGFLPHMHFLGRRMWSEKLQRKPGSEGILEDLSELEKVEDLGRDDAWTFNNQRSIAMDSMRIQNGDYIAVTCLYDSDERDEVTVGNIGSYDEMCIAFYTFYPAGAADTVLLHSGPGFSGEMSEKDFKSLKSFTEIMEFPAVDTKLPAWRQAYLSGDLKCSRTQLAEDFIKQKGVYVDEEFGEEIFEICGQEIAGSVTVGHDLVEKPECSTECAVKVFEMLGCGLMKEGKLENGEVMQLYPSNMEINAQALCGEVFSKYYEEHAKDLEKPGFG
ncbi:hypothetical protein BSKO_12377 [Bryopsis sp. KO-2023]|nr:hypothetical protein BSKO_12377 [Bryopsis sp. KO-2023]